MKVLKFGGTSVGSANSILNLKNIVESQDFPVVVVVSALGGVTDLLIKTARTASEGNEAYKDMFQAIVRRHHDMINDVITDGREDLLLWKQMRCLQSFHRYIMGCISSVISAPRLRLP